MKEAFEDQMLRILAIFGFISLAIGFAEGESETVKFIKKEKI